jgi:hypothetical protein
MIDNNDVKVVQAIVKVCECETIIASRLVSQVMHVIDLAILALEHASHTLSAAPFVVRWLKHQFVAPADVRNETNTERALRVTALASLNERLADVMAPNGPAIMAALLDPKYGVAHVEQTLGLGRNGVKETIKSLGLWINAITPSPNSVNDDDDSNEYMLNNAAPPSARESMRASLNEYVNMTRTGEYLVAHPVPTDVSAKEVCDVDALLSR